MHLYLKNLFGLVWFFCRGCLKPHDWGILQCMCYRWLQHNLLCNQRKAWKVKDVQIREKSVVAVLRFVTYLFFGRQHGSHAALTPVGPCCRLESEGSQPGSTADYWGAAWGSVFDTTLISEHWSWGEPLSCYSPFHATQSVLHTKLKILFNEILSVSVFSRFILSSLERILNLACP